MNETVFRILLTLKDEIRDAEGILKNIEALDRGGKAPANSSLAESSAQAFRNGSFARSTGKSSSSTFRRPGASARGGHPSATASRDADDRL